MEKEKRKENQRGFHRGEEEPQGIGGKRSPVLGERGYQQKKGSRNRKGGEERRGEAAEEGPLGTGKDSGHTFLLGISNTKIPLRAFASLKCEAGSCAPQQQGKGSPTSFLLLQLCCCMESLVSSVSK